MSGLNIFKNYFVNVAAFYMILNYHYFLTRKYTLNKIHTSKNCVNYKKRIFNWIISSAKFINTLKFKLNGINKIEN